MAGTHGVSTFQINSKFASGNLVFYEKGVGRTATGDVFTVGTEAVKVGGTAQDVDFQVYGTGSLSAIIDIGAATLTLVGLTSSTDKPLTISDATESTSTTTGALIVSGGIGFAKDMYVGDDIFLTSGAVINFNAGNVTLTHSAGKLLLTSASLGAAVIALDVRATVSAPNNQSGMSGYFDATINGTTAGHCYGLGSWINTGATSPVLSAGHIITPFEGGVYAGESQATARIVFAGQYQAQLTDAPTTLHAWRLNVAAAGGSITALIAGANAGSVGFASGQTASTQAGTIAIADIVGTGVVYINTYTTSA